MPQSKKRTRVVKPCHYPLLRATGCQSRTRWWVTLRLQRSKIKKGKRVRELRKNPSRSKMGKNITDAETLTRERNLAKENGETLQANINDENMQDYDDQQPSEKDIVQPEDISNARPKSA
ncbi:hypothetical protein TNCV_4435201 [Trichonephila clavipes]|nr:hypothetical protein TNCV_4435201 [Trichonephila clavipes]